MSDFTERVDNLKPLSAGLASEAETASIKKLFLLFPVRFELECQGVVFVLHEKFPLFCKNPVYLLSPDALLEVLYLSSGIREVHVLP